LDELAEVPGCGPVVFCRTIRAGPPGIVKAPRRARDLFKQLAELGKDADSGRDGLEEARQSLSRG
jgi:hypothetical protein